MKMLQETSRLNPILLLDPTSFSMLSPREPGLTERRWELWIIFLNELCTAPLLYCYEITSSIITLGWEKEKAWGSTWFCTRRYCTCHCSWSGLWSQDKNLRHGGAATSANHQEAEEECCSWGDEGWEVLGEEAEEQGGDPQVTRGEETEGEPDCAESSLSREGKQGSEAGKN